MAALPIDILLGIYLGILTGIIPAIVAWGLGFIFKYFTGVTVPALAVVVLAVAIAGVNGGLLSIIDPTVTTAPNAEMLITAILVVMMMSLYAHSQGDKLGAAFPKHISLRKLREQTLSVDVAELVGGKVRITVVGQVEDIEGYPPLSQELRTTIQEGSWTYPADIPLSELETRLANTLRTEYDLADVSVQIDERGRATIAAAPPSSGVSKRVSPGKRAVSIHALVPTGLARGDEISILTDGETYTGTVVSFQSTVAKAPAVEPDGAEIVSEPVSSPSQPTADGGDGRITVAVDRNEAERLLNVNRGHIIVLARGTRREFELLSLLRRTGKRLRRLTVRDVTELPGTTIGGAAIRDTFGVGILALRTGDGWTLAPRGSMPINVNDELFVVGRRDDLDRFQEVIR